MKRFLASFICFFLPVSSVFCQDIETRESRAVNELPAQGKYEVRILENPNMKKPFVVIGYRDVAPSPHLTGPSGKYSRPDYRMLDYRTKPKDVGYDGPVSDRTKVYVFAATVAASGLVVASTLPVAAASASASAAGGGIAFTAAGTAVAVGTVSSALLAQRPDPNRDSFIHESRIRVFESNE